MLVWLLLTGVPVGGCADDDDDDTVGDGDADADSDGDGDSDADADGDGDGDADADADGDADADADGDSDADADGDADACDGGRRWAEPGCDGPPKGAQVVPVGCYQPCDNEGACDDGGTCVEVYLNPCLCEPDVDCCQACGAIESLCVPIAGEACDPGEPAGPVPVNGCGLDHRNMNLLCEDVICEVADDCRLVNFDPCCFLEEVAIRVDSNVQVPGACNVDPVCPGCASQPAHADCIHGRCEVVVDDHLNR
jgi:hypothetical protein